MKGIFAIVVLIALAVAGQVAVSARRPVKSPAVEEGVFAAFGGLRSVFAEIVWFRADRLQEEGRYVELAQLAQALALAEPHTPEIWSYAAWNLAYNVSLMMPTGEDRWRWVVAAMKLLRDEGLRINPESAGLHRELAWLFQLKIGSNLDAAAETYRAKWREIVADVERRGAWGELSMDPEAMADVERRFGVSDRGDPQYSALYWAWRGIKTAKGPEVKFLHDLARQAKAMYEKTRREASGG